MNILIVDNYDSFTYNLVQCLGKVGANVVVKLNDKMTVAEIDGMDLDGIVFSPGPGTPENAADVGVCAEILKAYDGKIPILGVCLGHQLMGHFFGGTIARTNPMHGETCMIEQKKPNVLFDGCADAFLIMRYHSLIVEAHDMPDVLRVTATTKDGIVMAFEHESMPLFGVQFHPESIGTPDGQQIIENFVAVCKKMRRVRT
jgi:anthranilate synthase component 2